MKTVRHFFVFALLLSMFNVQGIQAQGFFKKLAKAAGKVLESATANSSSTTSSTTRGDANGYIPNVKFQITGCDYWGDGVLVRFVLTNNTSEDMYITIDNTSDNADYAALDENNNKHAFVPVVGGKELTGLGDGYSATLPAGVPVKGYFDVSKVATNIKMLNGLTFGGLVNKTSNNGGGTKYTYRIGSQAITYPSNTNRDNIFLSFPRLNYTYSKAYRSGKNVVLEGTLVNKGSEDVKMTSIFNDEQSQVYDSEGNTYKVSLIMGSNSLSSTTPTKFPVDIPVKCKVVIENVPTTIHEFSIVKKYFDIWDYGYYLQFRNLKF